MLWGLLEQIYTKLLFSFLDYKMVLMVLNDCFFDKIISQKWLQDLFKEPLFGSSLCPDDHHL